MPHLPVEPKVVGEANDTAIDSRTHKPLFQQVLEQVAILALLPAYQRREKQKSRTARQQPDAVDNLVPRLHTVIRPVTFRTSGPLA